MSITEDLKLALAKDITAAYVRNEAVKPTPEQATEMFRSIYDMVESIAKEKESSKPRVGLG